MEIDPKVIAFRCSQCGQKIDLDTSVGGNIYLEWPEFNEYNTAHTRRIVNEAEILNAKLKFDDAEKERQYQERKDKQRLEAAEKMRQYQERKDKKERNVGIIMICVAILAYLLLPFGPVYRFIEKEIEKRNAISYIEKGYITPGKSAYDFRGEYYGSVVAQLESVGFKNIKKISSGGIFAVWAWNEVTDIMIDGNNHFEANAYFPPEADVIVTYY